MKIQQANQALIQCSRYDLDSIAKTQEDKKTLQRLRSRYKQQNQKHKFVQRMDLSWYKIGQIGAMYIANCNWLNIQELLLNGTYIGDKGCKILSRIRWKKLKYFELFLNQINVSGAVHLSKAQWPELDTFYFGSNYFMNQGSRVLTKANWGSLKTIYLFNNSISREVIEFYCICEWNHLTIIQIKIQETPERQIKELKNRLKARFAQAQKIVV